MISIILPFKNTEKYLPECLESIVHQSERDWELLAVNDHSSDSSREILNSFSSKDTRIKLFDNQNSGIIDALKTGYKNSIGDYIHRMDSDDIMPDNKLSILKSILEKWGKGHISTGMVKYFSTEDISKGYKDYERWLNGLNTTDRYWEEIYNECVIASPAWMIHRKDFDQCGAFDSVSYPEDYDLVFRFYKNKLKVKGADSLVHLWREHPGRISRNSKNYQQEAFYRLKTNYWLDLEKDQNRPLALIGAGIKNKLLRTILEEKEIKYVSFNQAQDFSAMHLKNWIELRQKSEESPQLIITIAEKRVKNEIRKLMVEIKFQENCDFFFFS